MDIYDAIGFVCRCIPEGRVASYGQIARLCGQPRHARQVGYALRADRCGPVPAHRVVNGRGELSGAGHFPSWDAQRALLLSEGVIAARDGAVWRVDMETYQWRPGPAELDAIGAALKELEG